MNIALKELESSVHEKGGTVDASNTKAIMLLIDEFKELHRRAGSPPVGELARHSHNKLSKNVLNAYFSEQAVNFSSWRQASAYITACYAAAESNGVDRRWLGTLDEWHARWVAAMKGDFEAASPMRDSVSSAEPVDTLDDIDDDAVVSTGRVLQRLEKDLLRLQKSLSAYDGLLIVISGPRFGSLYKVDHNITTIGRDPRCDVWLNELTVSRHHAEIYRDGDKFIYNDLNSKNGTFRRNIRLKNSLLRSYDEFKVGRLRLLFVQGGDSNGNERFQSSRYDSVRSHLIQDSVADTSEIDMSILSGEGNTFSGLGRLEY